MRRVGLATDYLHANYARPLDFRAIAKAAGLPSYPFMRLFMGVHRMTPVAYLHRKRASVAVRLLQESRHPLAEIALRVGFAHHTSLLRQIRRWTGLDTSQIRAQGPGHNAIRRLLDQPLALGP